MDTKDIRQFFISVLKKDINLSDLDTSENSSFDDLVIKPHIAFSKAIFDEIELNRKSISLSNLALMTPEQLDAIASKFFVKRRTTGSVSLEIVVYFNMSSDKVLSVLTTDSFNTGDGIKFNPIQNSAISPATLPIITVNNQTFRVATISVISYNTTRLINANEITAFTLNHPAIVNVTNVKPSTTPVLAEDNSQLISKINNSLFNKNLINRCAISNGLTEAFPSILSIFSIGYGDPEMQRDIVPACKDWSMHVGGTVDIFVRTALKPVTITAKATRVSGNMYRIILKRYKGFDSAGIDISSPHLGLLYGWERVTLPDITMPEISNIPELPVMFVDTSRSSGLKIGNYGIDYVQFDSNTNLPSITVLPFNSQNLRYSIYEQVEIRITMSLDAGNTPIVTLPYYTTDSLESIQSFVSDPLRAIQCADTIVKSFIPVLVSKIVIKYNQKYSADFTSLSNQIANIVNNWNSSDDIKLSSLLAVVPIPVRLSEGGNDYPHKFVSPDGSIDSLPDPSYYIGPTYVETIQYNIDGQVLHSTSTNKISAIENATLSATRRTVKYFLLPNDVIFLPDQ